MSDIGNNSGILYKYRYWGNPLHQRILSNNELYLASPKDFNDPFDCRIPTNYFLLDSPRKIKDFVSYAIERDRDFLLSSGSDLKREESKLLFRLTNSMDEVQKEHEEILFESQNEHYGVISLSATWKSILMWSQYSMNHAGFCVGFWYDRLVQSKKFGRGGLVDYSNSFPDINPSEENLMEKVFMETHSKALDWGYEKEYRLVNVFMPNPPTTEERRIIIDNSFFAEIILGLLISERHKKQICKIALKKGIPVYETFKVPFQFMIDRRRIQ